MKDLWQYLPLEDDWEFFFDGQMSNILALGQTRNLGSRSNGSGREEVAGGGVGEVLEERGEGAQPCHRPSMEVVPDWVWQAGLIKYSIYISHTCTIYPL